LFEQKSPVGQFGFLFVSLVERQFAVTHWPEVMPSGTMQSWPVPHWESLVHPGWHTQLAS
jgi:hypothetical protein